MFTEARSVELTGSAYSANPSLRSFAYTTNICMAVHLSSRPVVLIPNFCWWEVEGVKREGRRKEEREDRRRGKGRKEGREEEREEGRRKGRREGGKEGGGRRKEGRREGGKEGRRDPD